MKDFDRSDYATNYIRDMEAKLPGYQFMFELIFKGVLPAERLEGMADCLIIGGSILETQKMLSKFPATRLTLVDNSANMLHVIKQALPINQPNITYIQQAFEDFEPTIGYQVSFALLVLHFIDDKAAFLHKLFQSLDKHGICIISAFSNQHLNWWKEYALASGANQADVMRTFTQQKLVMHSVAPQEIERLALEAGFQRIEKIAQILSIDLWILYK